MNSLNFNLVHFSLFWVSGIALCSLYSLSRHEITHLGMWHIGKFATLLHNKLQPLTTLIGPETAITANRFGIVKWRTKVIAIT